MTTTTRSNERGIALVLALFLMTALSILGASLMFLSQTETYASMNYRMMSQSRYAAESGVQKASSFLLDPTQYDPMNPGDPLSNYDLTKSPVICVANCAHVGSPVVLSANAAVASNYPYAAAQTGFAAAAQGALTVENGATLNYKTTATLMSMQPFDSYGGAVQLLQVWRVTSDGSQAGTRSAVVEVEATIDSEKVPANSMAAFATASTCDALYLHGNVQINSYDSSSMAANTNPTTVFEGGDVGSNGNVHIQGSIDLGGNMYSPRAGVGSCSNGAITAETITGGGWSQNGSLMQLPHALVYPPPVFSTIPPPTAVTINSALLLTGQAAACASLGLVGGTNCTIDAVAKTVTVNGNGTDVTMPSVTVAGGYKLIIAGHAPQAQNVNINSFSGDVQINANLGATNAGESVVLKVYGKDASGNELANPFDLGAWTLNSNFDFDASTLQIVYGGHASLSMGGNNSAAASIYAPNAAFSLHGTADLYGSILAATIDNGGNPSIHYDSSLQTKFFVQGHPMLGTFTWKRF